MSFISLHEITMFVLTAVLFLAYHVHLYLSVGREPLTTAIGITNYPIKMWVEGIIRDMRDTLAAQTLRNQIMAATFLASIAILICLGLFSAAFRPGVFMEVSHAIHHRHAWFFPVRATGFVAVRSELDVSGESMLGNCSVSIGS